MNIQWYPGHMVKARRKIAEDLKLVDIVIELLDARIPVSSRNPDVDEIVGNKKRIIVLNKSDLSDPVMNEKWISYFTKNDTKCILTDATKGKGLFDVINASNSLMKEKEQRLKQKGLSFMTIRALIIGIPNVGKSSFINKLAGRAVAKTGDRPGVTKAKQWIKVSDRFELLDTPGILWPKFEDQNAGYNLAFTGAIRDDILDINELSKELLIKLIKKYPKYLEQRYKLSDINPDIHPDMLLDIIGKKRGCIISGGNVDIKRTAVLVLDEFRGGKIGKITLESPDEYTVK